ncbi:MAG: (d)CMP kinase [Actinomycetota bacterium]
MTAIAIDGPAGAGKSTVARAAARSLGYEYIDTGAMYRAIAWAALERGVDERDEPRLAALARSLLIEPQEDRLMVDGRDATAEIRGSEVTSVVSVVSAHPAVRAAMVDRQRALTRGRNVVMEGRDIASVVLPDAAVKVFLTASLTERARRRCRQLGLPEDPATLAATARDLELRDTEDSNRTSSPLTRSPEAVVIDSSDRSVEEVVAEIAALEREVA